VCSDNERELGKTERGEHENQEGDEVIKMPEICCPYARYS